MMPLSHWLALQDVQRTSSGGSKSNSFGVQRLCQGTGFCWDVFWWVSLLDSPDFWKTPGMGLEIQTTKDTLVRPNIIIIIIITDLAWVKRNWGIHCFLDLSTKDPRYRCRKRRRSMMRSGETIFASGRDAVSVESLTWAASNGKTKQLARRQSVLGERDPEISMWK